MSEINPGDVVRVLTDPPFTDEDGYVTDPDTVTLRWKVGLGGEETVWIYGTDAEIIKDSVGTYYADLLIEAPGLHYFRWEGSGGLTAAEESRFYSRTRFDTA